jgi:hypothetical protein
MFFTVGHIWSELRILPDPKLTPGGVNSNITFELLTTKGWSTKFVRNVTEEEKNIVFKLYNINPKDYPPKSFEIDHLISLELGGDNSISNLWPEPYFGKVNAHTKDRLEDRLHKLVVTKQITLRQAQLEISTNWVTAFNKYFNTNLTL